MSENVIGWQFVSFPVKILPPFNSFSGLNWCYTLSSLTLLTKKKEKKNQSEESLKLNCGPPRQTSALAEQAQGMLPPTAEMYQAHCLIMNSAQHGVSETEPQANTNSAFQICSDKPQSCTI